MNLHEIGWSEHFNQQFERHRNDGLTPARVACEEKEHYTVWCEHGELLARVSGRLLHQAEDRSEYPAVGDWVAAATRPREGHATIHALLPRRSCFQRKEAGRRTSGQIVAANVDTVFLVTGLDGNFNVNRVQRYLALAWDSGASPVIVLNKADLCDDQEFRAEEVELACPGAPVHCVSATTGDGIDDLLGYLATGRTVALLGSSGVGKSTLVNALVGDAVQVTQAVREADSRGRHTTTRRELVLRPGGGLLLDSPGMRELQLWGDEDTLSGSFDDIEALACSCRFSDCAHKTEPGCAVQEAIRSGSLSEERFQAYLKLQRELRFLAAKQDDRLRRLEQAKWKKITARNRKRPHGKP